MSDPRPNMPPFAFGQTVYVARADAYHRIKVPCEICFGKRVVRLELGNGEMQTVECEACGIGVERATGTHDIFQPWSAVESGAVNGIEHTWDEWHIRVGALVYRVGEVFTSREEAEERRVVLHREAEAQAARNREAQFTGHKKKVAWTAHYHRDAIRKLKQQIEWHESKLGKLRSA